MTVSKLRCCVEFAAAKRSLETITWGCVRFAIVLIALVAACRAAKQTPNPSDSVTDIQVGLDTLHDSYVHGGTECTASVDRTQVDCFIEGAVTVRDAGRITIYDWSCSLGIGRSYRVCEHVFSCPYVDAGPLPRLDDFGFRDPRDGGVHWEHDRPCEDG